MPTRAEIIEAGARVIEALDWDALGQKRIVKVSTLQHRRNKRNRQRSIEGQTVRGIEIFQEAMRPLAVALGKYGVLPNVLDRPSYCCGVCPALVRGGYDCTCQGNPRCKKGRG